MKTISMTAPVPLFQTLSDAIQYYADAAYPEGGSECAQTSRAGLLDVAQIINEHIASEKIISEQTTIEISRRIKSHLKAAIKYYIQICPELNIEAVIAEKRAASLLLLIDGKAIQAEDWQ